jgi:hypothetical protein
VKRLAFLLCLVAVGCGGQALPGANGGAKSESEIGTAIEASARELEAELASLESKNDQAGTSNEDRDAVVGGAEEPAAEAPPAEGGAPAAPPPEAAPTAAADEPAEVDEEAKKRDGCKTACRALESMKRTEARICELVGESHDKCTWAHARVKDAVARIERAACSCKS